MKKPTLAIVGATPPNPSTPPESLREAGSELWQAIHNDYVIENSGSLEDLEAEVDRVWEAIVSDDVSSLDTASAR